MSVTDAARHVTSYAYDDENNLSSITDANGHITNFVYDNLGRVKETDFPSGHAESYIYDVIGNLTSNTLRNGNISISFEPVLKRGSHSRSRYPALPITRRCSSNLDEVDRDEAAFRFDFQLPRDENTPRL